MLNDGRPFRLGPSGRATETLAAVKPCKGNRLTFVRTLEFQTFDLKTHILYTEL